MWTGYRCFEVGKLTTGWNLDSCICKIIIKKDQEENLILDSWKQKCQVHKDESDGNLLAAVIVHNRSFPDPTLRAAEKIRIIALGGPVFP